jgi:predicted DNA-binding transcriptional regulator AlpA
MTPKLLRFADLKGLGIVSNWPTLLRWIEDEGFPPGRNLGPNTRVWTDDEVAQWITERPLAGVERAGIEAA